MHGEIGPQVSLIQGDMVDFSPGEAVDFVYVLLESPNVKSTAELVNHFNCVVTALRRGGLYLLGWRIQDDPRWELSV